MPFKQPIAIALFMILIAAIGAGARSGGGGSHSRSYGGSHSSRSGRIHRDPAQKHAFERQHPCPSTGRAGGACPGYVVDHVKPLACGGADSPENMAWQTTAAAKAKDKWERAGCQ